MLKPIPYQICWRWKVYGTKILIRFIFKSSLNHLFSHRLIVTILKGILYSSDRTT